MVVAGWILLSTLLVGLVAFAWREVRTLGAIASGLKLLAEENRRRRVAGRHPGPMGRLVEAFNASSIEIQERHAQFEEDRQQLRVVLGAMAEAVVAVDSRRRLLFANASADALFGLDANSVGRPTAALIPYAAVRKAVEATLQLAHPNAYQGELTLPGAEASPRVLTVRGTPLSGGPTPGAVLVFHDVTGLRRLERLRQDFVANASHELKTPLASIKAYTETLLDWALADETINRRFLERIDEQVDRLNALILDMLSLARLESSQEPFEHGPLSLGLVVQQRVEAHRDRATAGGLSLTFAPGPLLEHEVLILADEEAIRQILDNLIDNAIKYTPEGGSVRVACSTTPSAVVVEVADDGVGIPRHDLPRIFERFYRVDKARSRELGGTGLGLAIAKHLVTSLRGGITVASRLGEGTRFTVQFPRILDPEPEQTEDARATGGG